MTVGHTNEAVVEAVSGLSNAHQGTVAVPSSGPADDLDDDDEEVHEDDSDDEFGEEIDEDWDDSLADEFDDESDSMSSADQRTAARLGLDVMGMDADGRSAWMRAIEEEDGLEGLYFAGPSSYESRFVDD